jgi:8-oxo-dGTP pyrophosphatase MutT (NUDIX family)
MNQTPNQRIAELLTAYTPADEKEAADRQLIERMLADAPNLMSRAHQAGHVTGSALVLDAQTGSFLLHYHKKLTRWLQFGGHAEPTESDPAQTALREAQEESGLSDLRWLVDAPLDIDVHPIPARGNEPAHLHLDFRYALLTAKPNALHVNEDESDNFAWLTLEEMVARSITVDPSLDRLIRKALRLFREQTSTP